MLGAAFIVMSLTGGFVWIDGTTKPFASEWYRIGSALAGLWFLRLNLRRENFDMVSPISRDGEANPQPSQGALAVSIRLGVTLLSVALAAGLVAGAVAFPFLSKIGFLQDIISDGTINNPVEKGEEEEGEEIDGHDMLASAKSNRDIVTFLLQYEGGFFNFPDDPGGATNFGISMAILSAFEGRPVSAEEIRNLTSEDAINFYEEFYIERNNLDSVTDVRLRGMLTNFSVWIGPRRAIELMQDSLNRLGVSVATDGVMSRATVAGINAFPNPLELATEYACAVARHVRSLSIYKRFSLGMENRIVETSPVGIQDECPAPDNEQSF